MRDRQSQTTFALPLVTLKLNKGEEELTHSIDSKKLLSPHADNEISDENGLKLVLETIDSIIGEYNSTVKSLEESDENYDSIVEDDPLV